MPLPVSLSVSPKLMDMETLTQEDDNESAYKRFSFPNEIIQEIISRLPIKPILQFRSVSKHWLSLISHDPCFPKLHFNRSLATHDRTSFFISAFDKLTQERHFLTAPLDGGPVTHLITLHDSHYDDSDAEHLNGLVFFTSRNVPIYGSSGFVINPATRKVFKVPPPPNRDFPIYFFGFDEFSNEHNILCTCYSSIRHPIAIGFMIFSLSTGSWRQIPVDLEELFPRPHIIRRIKHSVCVNSVMYFMLNASYQILAFHLTTEKFSIINLPQGAIPRELTTRFTRHGRDTRKGNSPFLIIDKGLLGVVCHDLVMETNKIHIWFLQDYVNRVWVRETVMVPESWFDLDFFRRIQYYDVHSYVSSCRRLSGDMVNAFILDMKTKSFKLVNFNLVYEFLHSNSVWFQQIRSYVESVLPLREE
uniref:putative F-box protein At3g23960 n=1 Tax=Erigeron canadensis TaxID=72917 RepID=UPI001CB9795A|nr:putative F-box protein At3g23960 [Erigeron canadensis]